MSNGSKLGQLLWDEDDPSGLCWGRIFWNQVKIIIIIIIINRERERAGEKRERMIAAGMFLNEREKENKRRE